ncbi:uncharacterized protein [Halyomorpha halys]|uniref:uncharacterized protein isoform X2 n=1 Tax=Halyomorpha halys TaxID=286706 RepID=UPI0006D4EE4A|nr:E3 ubiquitin-protein ligase CCNB1IP1 isoform X2 [Halyomorpha halys]
MNDFSLCCNIPKCNIPLNDISWVTRCMHVFCPGHGQAYFSNPSPQISCPICNEINLKEVDILQCEINPIDIILVGISPEKATQLAAKSMRLWWYQIQQQQCLNNSKLNSLAEKNSDMKHNYNLVIAKIKHKYDADINAMKTNEHNLLKKLEDINFQLETTKKELLKYKKAYCQNHDRQKRNVLRSPVSPNWLGNEVFPVTTNRKKHKIVLEVHFLQ